MGTSAFGVDHGDFSKAETTPNHRKRNVAVGAAGTVGAGGAVALGTNMPEHSHYSKETRKYIKSLPAGVHEVDTKMLAKRPRKLGARKQQAPYVATMAQERPTPYAPVPVTRYRDGVIQRDSAHSVMANAMKGRKTLIKIEDAPGYRPSRRTGEELIRRGQMRYQQRRLKQHMDLPDEKINAIKNKYKNSSRKANTAKRPHGVVEEGFKHDDNPFGLKRALKPQGVVSGAKRLATVVRKDRQKRDVAAGATGAAGVGVLASTPVRRSAAKVDIKDGRMASSDAKKILNPGYRPGNARAMKVMARNLGHLEHTPTKVIQYADGRAIPFDGNHRGTARVVRGDKSIPVQTIKGGERPAVSVTRNAYHGLQQKIHQNRMKRNVFTPTAATGKHAGQGKVYSAIANGSPARSGRRVAVDASRAAMGPSKTMLRSKQAATIGAGAALLGTAEHLRAKKKS